MAGRHLFPNGRAYILRDVHHDSLTFRSVEQLVQKTWESRKVGDGRDAKFNYSHDHRLMVLSIQKVDNPQLSDNYTESKRRLLQRYGSCPVVKDLPNSDGQVKTTEYLDYTFKKDLEDKINEHYLFHGFRKEFLEPIVKNGFNPESSSPTAMCGQAVYFAESSTKADQYADFKDERTPLGAHLKMVLARVLLGNVLVVGRNHPFLEGRITGPPCTRCERSSCHCGAPSYDSVMATNSREGGWIFREFAVYDTALCYPEYIITYKRE